MSRVLPRTAAALTFAALVAAGCMGPATGGPPDGVDWFGNPLPTGPACDARPAEPPVQPPYNPQDGGRPAAVPAGWSWMVLTFRVAAAGPDKPGAVILRADHCVPVHVHVYVKQERNPSPIKMDMGSGVVTPLPYDGVIVTPWRNSYLILAYNPKDWDGPPPSYQAELIATWSQELDTSGAAAPIAIGCGIGIAGGSELAIDTVTSPSPKMTARCRITHNAYWLA